MRTTKEIAERYGAPVLVYICERFWFPMPPKEMIARVGDGSW